MKRPPASIGPCSVGSSREAWTSRSRRPAPAAAARATRSAPRCRPALDARLALPPGVPIGLPAELPPGLLQVEWCAPFGGVVRTALHQLKYAGERRLARPLGEAIARRWAAVGAGGDLLVPVPVHRARAAQRGYDQAVLLAEAAATALGLPAATVLERQRATVAQYHLDRPDRAANVAGAFAIGVPCRGGGRPRPMGRPRRRRHDHRRHAVGVRGGPRGRRRPRASRRSRSPASAESAVARPATGPAAAPGLYSALRDRPRGGDG